MLHHVVWRSRGGPTTFENLVTLCARCHGLVHDGFLGVGHAPDGGGFVFTDRNGCPLDGRHPAVATSIAVTACATAHAAPPAAGGVAPLRSEDDIPSVVDRAWWDAHQHELEWTARGIRVRRPGRRAS